MPLRALTCSRTLSNLIDPSPQRRSSMALFAHRLEAHGGKGEKAFGPGNPLRKPDRRATRPPARRSHSYVVVDTERPESRYAGRRRIRRDAAGGRFRKDGSVTSGTSLQAPRCESLPVIKSAEHAQTNAEFLFLAVARMTWFEVDSGHDVCLGYFVMYRKRWTCNAAGPRPTTSRTRQLLRGSRREDCGQASRSSTSISSATFTPPQPETHRGLA